MARYAHVSERPELPLWAHMASLIGHEAAEHLRIEMKTDWQDWLDRPKAEQPLFENKHGALPGSKFCPECKGRGQINDWLNQDRPDCPACDGTGFKEIITLEDYA